MKKRLGEKGNLEESPRASLGKERCEGERRSPGGRDKKAGRLKRKR